MGGEGGRGGARGGEIMCTGTVGTHMHWHCCPSARALALLSLHVLDEWGRGGVLGGARD